MPQNPDVPAVSAADIHKAYETTAVLKGIDLVVERGSIFSLVGP